MLSDFSPVILFLLIMWMSFALEVKQFHFALPMTSPHHICCCPSGSMPVDGSSSSTTDGLPSMLSAKHSWNERNSVWLRPAGCAE